MKTKPEIFRLLFDGNGLDDNPRLISSIGLDDCGFDRRNMLDGRSLQKQWPKNFKIYVNGSEPVDYFISDAYYEVVSDRVKKAIESSLKEYAESVEFLPTEIIADEVNRTLSHYWVINVIRILDGLDWEHTIWIDNTIPFRDSHAILNMIKPALKAREIRGTDIFKFRVGEKIAADICISAPLKRKLKQLGATVGMDFLPIKVTES